MSTENLHPLVLTFDNLLDLRQYAAANQTEATAQFVTFCAANMMRSQAQLFQDLFVVFFLRGKRNGFFVEFGATDGSRYSNTFVLERDFQWNGVLAEPARCWHAALRTNRRAAIDTRCVWSESGLTLDFKETDDRMLSTVTALADKDLHRDERINGATYPVETVSLMDLLLAHRCPRDIDYLSIDTEGSEFVILSKFDFSKYAIKILTVEHNFCEPDRQNIHDLLVGHGFIRIFEAFSKFDDWYIQRSMIGG